MLLGCLMRIQLTTTQVDWFVMYLQVTGMMSMLDGSADYSLSPKVTVDFLLWQLSETARSRKQVNVKKWRGKIHVRFENPEELWQNGPFTSFFLSNSLPFEI